MGGRHTVRLSGGALLRVGCLLLIPTSAGAASPRGTWRPLDLITEPARPRPLTDEEALGRAMATVIGRNRRYEERAFAAKELAGARDTKVVGTLARVLVEARPQALKLEADKLRMAVAEALAWHVAAGDAEALAALHAAWFHEDTYIRAGRAIARALLVSQGPDEVVRFMQRLMDVESRRPKTVPPPAECATTVDDLRSWVEGNLRSCYVGPGRSPDGLLEEATTRYAARLRRMNPRQLAEVFGREDAPETLGVWAGGPGGRALIKAVLAGRKYHPAALRQLVTAWIVEGGEWTVAPSFHGALDTDLVLTLAAYAASSPEPARGKLRAFLERLCHGRLEAVMRGTSPLADIVREVVKKTPLVPERDGEQTSDEGLPEIDPWQQLANLPVRFETPERCPAVPILLDRRNPIFERCVAACVLSEAAANKAFGSPDRLATVIDELIGRSRRTTNGAREEYHEAVLFYYLVEARLQLSSPEDQMALFLDLLDRRRTHPVDKALALRVGAERAYLWMADRGPVRVAEQVVSCLEQLVAARIDTTLLKVGGDALLESVLHLTPEVLELASDRHAGRSLGPEAWNEDVAAAWRAWLERFRKLPVFRSARKASAVN